MARHIGQDITVFTVGVSGSAENMLARFSTIELDEQNLITTVPATKDTTVYRRITGGDFSLRISGIVDTAPLLEAQIRTITDGAIVVSWTMEASGHSYTIPCLIESVKLSIGGDGTVEEMSCVARGLPIVYA